MEDTHSRGAARPTTNVGERQRYGSEDAHFGDGSSGSESAQHRARERARDVASKTRESVEQQASRQKESAADQIDDVGRALRETSDNLRNQHQDSMAGLIGDAAGQVDRLSGYLRERSVEDLLTDVRRFARDEPGLFLGGAALLGMLGGRFLRSSERSSRTRREVDHNRSSERY